ncbi:MAG: bifunctional pyr operon transcriptional regulator/uracil phosphoribosyltransferase PyrR [Verrucomicrobiota bacterium]
MNSEKLLDARDVEHKLLRIAMQIVEKHPEGTMGFVGIHKRGVPMARRVAEMVEAEGPKVELGTIDISFYRDDLHHLESNPEVHESKIDFSVDGAHVVIFDDVLFTGRTIRAAIDSLVAFGRPARIELATLVDRGFRELPIQADYVGEEVEAAREAYVRVRLKDHDDEDSVTLFPDGKPAA